MPVLPDTTLLCCFTIAAVAIMLLAAQWAQRGTKSQTAATLVTLATVAYAALSQYYQAPWFT